MTQTAQTPLVNVTIDGLTVQVPKGTLLVEAAKLVQNEIPVYCYHTKLGPAGLCRVCLVEIEGMPKLQIACNTPVTDGMVVKTQNDRVNDGRRSVLEFLLVNHPLDCPICDKGGECDLQDFSMAYGQSASRLAEGKVAKPKAVDLGPTIVLDEERCIVCQRCVRFDDIITRERSLVVKDRGHKDIIATASDEPYRSNFSGNVTELCPVGALTSKTYRFKSRPWDLHREHSTCTQCSVGCQLNVDERHGTVLRTMSVPQDDAISEGWLCDRGRYNVGFFDSNARITTPLYKRDGQWNQIEWADALDLWARAIKDAIAQHGTGSVGVLGGGRLLNEEAYVLAYIFRALGVSNLDWRGGRQRQGTPGAIGGTLVDLENAKTIIVAGRSPAQTAPVMDLRIRKAVYRHGAKLIVVGSLEAPPPVPFERAATVEDARKGISPEGAPLAVVWDGIDPAVGAALAALSPAHAFIAGEQANARGAEAMGMHPAFAAGFRAVDGGHDFATMVQDARADKLAVLSILGANPALHFPDGPAIDEALQRIPFVVVSDLFLTKTAQYATLVLPAQGAFEKSGTTVNLEGSALPLNTGLRPPAGTLRDLDMLIGLGAALEVALPSVSELDEAVIAALAATPLFTLGDTAICGNAAAGARGERGLRVETQANIFSGGGTAAFDERIETLRPLPQAAISPELAAQHDLHTGDCIDLRSGQTTMHDLLVEVRPYVPSDVVVLIDGLPDDPANAFAQGVAIEICNVRAARDLEPAGVSR